MLLIMINLSKHLTHNRLNIIADRLPFFYKSITGLLI